MPARPALPVPQPAAPAFSAWARALLITLAALLLCGLFSREIYDSDFWWHLRTGQYIVETRSLPFPDPFSWTTATARDTYPGEGRTRQFNLRHEWLAQVVFYVVWRAGGAAGIVAARALSMTAFCALIGLIAWRRRRNFYAALAAAMATASVAQSFALDRPYHFTYLLLSATLAIIEFRRHVWALPALFAIWANCHGGYFLGWVVLGAHCAESLLTRRPDRKLWIATFLSVLASGLNPNGFRIFRTLLDYQSSYLTSRLIEWARPVLWPPSAFSVLLSAAVLLILWQRRRVRIADWMIFAAFAAASLAAQRNVILIGLIAPLMLVAYLPWPFWIGAPAAKLQEEHPNRSNAEKAPRKPGAPAREADSASAGRLPVGPSGRKSGLVFDPSRWTGHQSWTVPLAAVLLLLATGIGVARGSFFQFRAAEWKVPRGAADFLLAHHITGPMFNTYEYGGYLIWRAWPVQRTFIDGRALSEAVFQDYARILYNHDSSDGMPSGEELLNRYGLQVIVMNTFEYAGGQAYVLAPALADPAQAAWKLVFNDPQALIFMRTPPPGIAPLNSLDVLSHMEDECAVHLEHEPDSPRCARSLGQIFSKVGDFGRARKWVGLYLQSPHPPDPEAEQAYQQLLSSGR